MGSVMSMLSQLMYVSEKMIACFTCTMLVTCIIVTFIVILGLGIGLGYNYCFVDIKTKHRYVPISYRYPGGKRYIYPNYQDRNYNPRAGGNEYPDPTLPLLRVPAVESTLPLTTDTHPQTTLAVAFENSTEAFIISNTSLAFITTVSMSKSVVNGSTESPSIMNDTIKPTEATEKPGPLPMIIPINGLDLIALLSKLRSENRNYSLQIVTS